MYFAVQKGSSNSTLHSLIVRINIAELQLGCLLEAIHVPGTVMIIQGKDGLSRGVWVSPLHKTVEPVLTTAQVFDPIPFTSAFTPWVLQEAGLVLDTLVTSRPWYGHWAARPVLRRTTIWCSPSEMARQLLYFLLGRWVAPWELRSDPNDTALVILERARLIDTTHHWAASTHKQYQSKLRMVRQFEGDFGVSILRPTPLTKPPSSPDVPALWLQQQFSIRPGGFRAGEENQSAVGWITVRGLLSSISQFYS